MIQYILISIIIYLILSLYGVIITMILIKRSKRDNVIYTNKVVEALKAKMNSKKKQEQLDVKITKATNIDDYLNITADILQNNNN